MQISNDILGQLGFSKLLIQLVKNVLCNLLLMVGVDSWMFCLKYNFGKKTLFLLSVWRLGPDV